MTKTTEPESKPCVYPPCTGTMRQVKRAGSNSPVYECDICSATDLEGIVYPEAK